MILRVGVKPGSSPGPQNVQRAETTDRGAGIEDEEHDEKQRLWNFENSKSADICYAFLDRGLLSKNHYIVEGSMMALAGLKTWIETVITCLIQREHRGGHR